MKLPGALSEREAAALVEALEDFSCSHAVMRETGREGAPWILSCTLQDAPDKAALTSRLALTAKINNIEGVTFSGGDWVIEEIPDKNWLEECYRKFPPFLVENFFVYGSHYDGPKPDEKICLQIDAATAFGSGEHGTTRGCLLALHDLKDDGVCPWNVLDMGCGSGILAIAAWKLWKTPVLAVDNDAECIRVTLRHADFNGIKAGAAALDTACGDGFATPALQSRNPFDLIIANILAGPLIEMAPALKEVLDVNGYVVLSGMLREQADDVLKVYEGHKIALKRRYDIDEWSTLVLQG